MSAKPKLGSGTRSIVPGFTLDDEVVVRLGTVNADQTAKYAYYARRDSRVLEAALITSTDLAVDSTNYVAVKLQKRGSSTVDLCGTIATTQTGEDGEADIVADRAWSLNVDQNVELDEDEVVDIVIDVTGTVSLSDVVVVIRVRRQF